MKMIKKTIILFVFAIFLLSLVSANDYRFENSSGYNLMVISGNGDVNITQNLNLGGVLDERL